MKKVILFVTLLVGTSFVFADDSYNSDLARKRVPLDVAGGPIVEIENDSVLVVDCANMEEDPEQIIVSGDPQFIQGSITIINIKHLDKGVQDVVIETKEETYRGVFKTTANN